MTAAGAMWQQSIAFSNTCTKTYNSTRCMVQWKLKIKSRVVCEQSDLMESPEESILATPLAPRRRQPPLSSRLAELNEELRAESPRHNLSTGDGNSTEEGDSVGGGRNPAMTGIGCYKNYKHSAAGLRKSINSQSENYPQNSTGPMDAEAAPPYSPSMQHHNMMIDMDATEDQQLIMQDTPQHEPMSCSRAEVEELRRQVALETSSTSKRDKSDTELPSEFECCFCTSKEYKEFIDAEGLMPLPTSDFHTTVCLEMRMLKNNMNNNCIAPPAQFGPSTISYPYPYMDTPIKHSNNCNNNNASVSNNNSNSNNGDLASVDSSDTYASCQTHPFLSQGDLTSDIVDMSFDLDTLDTNNLYINPLEKDTQQQRSVGRGQVKKSASGDTGLRSLGMSPMDDEYKQFQTSFDTSDRGSRVSLNETPVPKHRKTRFQQGAASAAMAAAAARPKTRFENLKSSIESLDEAPGNGQAAASSSSGTSKKTRRSSFMPGSRSIASATKLINQHLFGIQNPAPKEQIFQPLSIGPTDFSLPERPAEHEHYLFADSTSAGAGLER